MFTTFYDQDTETCRQEPEAVGRAIGETTDNQLMERIQRRDEQAFEMLIKRFQGLVRSVVERIISNGQDVSDVIEEVFLGIWKQAANFDSLKGNPIGWIITIARRRAIDLVRRRQAYDRAEIRFRVSTESATSHFAGDDVEKSAMKTEMAGVFQKLLSALPVAQSAVVRMAYYRGLSQREIARETGIPLGTVKTRLELGVKKLREAVTAIGSREEWLFGTL
jgi:RNA polymerase sigma-70 factor, ECF subfamily